MTKKITLKKSAIVLFSIFLFVVGCESEQPKVTKKKVEHEKKAPEQKNVITKSVAKINGEIFSVPSPIQVVITLKENKVPFNKEVLNTVKNKDKYVSQFQQALNMGVYGADLAYVSAYQKSQDILKYFSAVKGLADDLGIRSNIDEKILTRFGENINNIDSLYSLSGELYKEANFYLNDNNRNQVAALILAGGWIESMYSIIHSVNNKALVKQKLGEQKSALKSIQKLLQNYDDPKVNGVKSKLGELNKVYQVLQTKYSYAKPITDVENKTTYLKGKTEVVMSDENLNQIVEIIDEIRNEIIK